MVNNHNPEHHQDYSRDQWSQLNYAEKNEIPVRSVQVCFLVLGTVTLKAVVLGRIAGLIAKGERAPATEWVRGVGGGWLGELGVDEWVGAWVVEVAVCGGVVVAAGHAVDSDSVGWVCEWIASAVVLIASAAIVDRVNKWVLDRVIQRVVWLSGAEQRSLDHWGDVKVAGRGAWCGSTGQKSFELRSDVLVAVWGFWSCSAVRRSVDQRSDELSAVRVVLGCSLLSCMHRSLATHHPLGFGGDRMGWRIDHRMGW